MRIKMQTCIDINAAALKDEDRPCHEIGDNDTA